MKKINSIHYGFKIIALSFVFLFFIPCAIKLISLVYTNKMLSFYIVISFVIGGAILCLFGVLLAIELHQDKKQSLYYNNCKNIKIAIANDTYECQFCGNRAVKANNRSCNICGINFDERDD